MMAFYTEKKRQNALIHLHIDPGAERVTSSEAAHILTWRAKEEYGIQHVYNATAVRKHAHKLDARPLVRDDGTKNTRQNTYDTLKIFEIDINPGRTNTSRWNREDKVLTR